MTKRTTNVIARATLSAALAGTLSLGVAGVASAGGNDGGSQHGGGSPQGNPFNEWSTRSGIVTALSSTSILVEGPAGTSTTYALTASTTFREGNETVSQSSLSLGERVVIKTSSSQSATAVSVDIILVELSGRVTSVSGSTITIVDAEGFSRSIDVDATTAYDENGNAATLADVVVGSRIEAAGTVDADKTSLDARQIHISSPITTRSEFVNGTVAALSVDSLTLNTRDGHSVSFAITSSTTFKQGDVDTTQAALVVGDQVMLRATIVSNSATNTSTSRADFIDIQLSKVEGVVTGVANGVITLTTAQNVVRSVVVSAATTYSQGGSDASFSDVTVGVDIEAQGTLQANGATLAALTVNIDVDHFPTSNPSNQGSNNSRHGNSNQPGTGSGHSGAKGRR